MLGRGDIVVRQEHDRDEVARALVGSHKSRNGVDQADDVLCATITRRRLRREHEGHGREVSQATFYDVVVERQYVQRLHELALVFVQALGLSIDDGVGIDLDTTAGSKPLGERMLVVGLHLIERLAERSILRIGLEFGDLAPILHEALADCVIDELPQAGVGNAQPTALCDAVRDADETLGICRVEIAEQRPP